MNRAIEIGFAVFMVTMIAIIVVIVGIQAKRCSTRGGVLALAVWPPVACVEVIK